MKILVYQLNLAKFEATPNPSNKWCSSKVFSSMRYHIIVSSTKLDGGIKIVADPGPGVASLLTVGWVEAPESVG